MDLAFGTKQPCAQGRLQNEKRRRRKAQPSKAREGRKVNAIWASRLRRDGQTPR